MFHRALSECGSLEVRPVAICVPQEIQEYCMELFVEDVQIAAASHDLFAKRANEQIYGRWWRRILQEKSACNSKTDWEDWNMAKLSICSGHFLLN